MMYYLLKCLICISHFLIKGKLTFFKKMHENKRKIMDLILISFKIVLFIKLQCTQNCNFFYDFSVLNSILTAKQMFTMAKHFSCTKNLKLKIICAYSGVFV